MKAAVYDRNGGPEVLRYVEVPEPVCPPGCVRIRNEAISIEGGDAIHRLLDPPPSAGHIVGTQAAGVILEVGDGVTGRAVGDRVVGIGAAGSHAEQWVVPGILTWPVPPELDLRRASTIPIPFGTAHECLFRRAGLGEGETVLVQAGASAVGIATIQLAHRAGARVLATASGAARLARLTDLGLDAGIDRATDDVAAEVRRLTDGRGVDVVVDPVGGPLLATSIASLSDHGRLIFVGDAGREPTLVDIAPLRPINASLYGVFFGTEVITARVQDLVGRLIQEVARGELHAVVDREFPLAAAADAHAYVESRAAVGRVLLIP